MFHSSYYELKIVQTIDEVKEVAELIKKSKLCWYDTETTGLRVRHPGVVQLVGYTFAVEDEVDERVFYIPVGHIFEGVYVPRINLSELKLDPAHFPDFDESILYGEYYNLDLEEVNKIIIPVFENYTGTWIAHNIGYDMHVLANEGVDMDKFFRERVFGERNKSIFDTMVAAHLINEENEKKLETIIEKVYGLRKTDYSDTVATVTNAEKKEVGLKSNNKASFQHTQISIGGRYSAEDVFFMKNLYFDLLEELDKEEQTDIFYKMKMPYVKDLFDMERVGVKIDEKRLDEMTEKAKIELDKLQYAMYEIAGIEFNINSGQQVAEILHGHKKKLKDKKSGEYRESFNENIVAKSFGFPVVSWTDGGKDKDKQLKNPQTNAESLEELLKITPKNEDEVRGKEFIKQLMKFNRLEKLYSSFMIGLRDNMYADGKVHPSYSMAGTETRRLSCDSPNNQQLPKPLEGDEEDYDFWKQFEIRSLYIPDSKDECIIASDFGALEKCITAEFTKDKALIELITNKYDAHGFTARIIFEECRDVHPNDVKKLFPHQRSTAKQIGFAMDYGGTEFTVSRNLGIDKKIARQYIDNYFEGFKGIAEWGTRQINFGRKHGYVTTLLGQRRHLSGIQSSNMAISSYYERVCKNFPIQGTASEVATLAQMKLNLNPVLKWIGVRIIMQVHD